MMFFFCLLARALAAKAPVGAPTHVKVVFASLVMNFYHGTTGQSKFSRASDIGFNRLERFRMQAKSLRTLHNNDAKKKHQVDTRHTGIGSHLVNSFVQTTPTHQQRANVSAVNKNAAFF